MNYITHSLGGAAAGMLVISVLGAVPPAEQAAIMAGGVLGSLFPDIDHKQSWIGHKLPIVASIMSGIFKHRGAIHTPVFVAVVSLVLGLINWGFLYDFYYLAALFIQGFIPGMISHLVLDTLNVQGIMWLWPFLDKRFHVLSIRTNSFMETVVCAALGICLYGQFAVFF